MSDEKRKPGRPRKVAPEELREAGPNRAEQGAEAVQIEPVSADPAPLDAVGLHAYIASLEDRRMADGVVLVHVSHPAASGDVFHGKYSGVRTSPGPLRAQWSDGTTTDA